MRQCAARIQHGIPAPARRFVRPHQGAASGLSLWILAPVFRCIMPRMKSIPMYALARWRGSAWWRGARLLAQRLHQERLGSSAASLTFTTVLALVPFFTVALALFAAFPAFARVQAALERWLVERLIPETIARQVLDYLGQFAAQAGQLGMFGFCFLLVTAIALILSVDRALNHIWRVPQLRPLGQRVLLYWAVMTLGPLLLGLSLLLSSSVMGAAPGLAQAGGFFAASPRLLLQALGFLALAASLAALYRYVPNTPVRWRHAWAGALLAAAGLDAAKRLLGWYLASVPTYSVIYGAFATLPIFLIWMELAWGMVLLGALLASSLPQLRAGADMPQATENGISQAGGQFVLALRILRGLHAARATPAKGLCASALAQRLHVQEAQVHAVLHALVRLDWVAAIAPLAQSRDEAAPATRYMLLIAPQHTPLAPLMEQLLLDGTAPGAQALCGHARWQALRAMPLADLLPAAQSMP